MGTVSELLAIAARQLHVRENPPESNNVRYNTWYYGREVSGPRYPWCMVFVQWCCNQAAVGLPIRTASCSALMNAAKAAGCWVTRAFQPGDIVIYDFSGRKETASHCGIVESAAYHEVVAIEGNTGAGNDANGGQVQRRTRAKKYIMGAVRPGFEEELEMVDIDKLLEEMTDKQAYTLLLKAQKHAATLPEPEWSEQEGSWQKATDAGIVNGTAPEGLVKRCELAAVVVRSGLVK